LGDGGQRGIFSWWKATVMKYNGSAWETVGNAGFSAGSISSISLRFGSEGTPYVSYRDKGNNKKVTVKKFVYVAKKAKQADAQTQYKLGMMYFKGKLLTQNYQKQYHLALMYNRGQGVTKNIQECVKWLGKAADQGHVQAQKILLKILQMQKILRRD
jgi:TPR repeat protein